MGLAASKHLHAALEEWCVKKDEKQDIVFHNYFMPAEQSMHPDPAVKMWAIDRPAQILLCPWMEKIVKMTLLILTTTQANNLKWHLGILTMLPHDILGFQPFFRAQMSLCLNTWKYEYYGWPVCCIHSEYFTFLVVRIENTLHLQVAGAGEGWLCVVSCCH